MAASRASSLGWIAGVFLGRQHGWASGESEHSCIRNHDRDDEVFKIAYFDGQAQTW